MSNYLTYIRIRVDKRVHFGLGEEREIKSLEIQWPSGIVQHIEHPTADRILRIEESGSKPVATEKKSQPANMGQGVAP